MKNQTKKYKRKSSKKIKSKRRTMKGGNCGCNNHMTGGLSNSSFFYPLNTHNTDPLAPSAIIDSRLLPNPPLKGGKRNRKIKGGSADLTKTFSTLATPFFPASNYMNPIVANGTTAGAISTNAILTGNPNITNPSTVIPPAQPTKYMV